MHLYYIPIVLMAYHYRIKGIFLSAFLGLLYVSMVTYFLWPDIEEVLLAFERIVIFIFAAAVIAWLSDKLERSRIFFKTLSEISPVGIIRTDTRGICSYVNGRFTEISGIPKEHAIGEDVSGLIYTEDKEKFFSDWTVCSQDGMRMSHEYRFQKPDGTTTWALYQAGPEKDEKGIITGYIATITDLSRIKTAEMFRRTQFAFDHSPDDIYFTNRAGEIVYANISARKSLGIESCSNSCKKTIFDINPDIDPKRWEEIWRIIVKEDYFKFESTHRLEKGSLQPVEISQYHLTYNNEEYSCSIARDITDRKRFETSLKESEEKYRTLVELAGEGILAVDVDGIISFVNPSMAKMLGYAIDEMTGSSLFDFIDEEGLDKSKKLFKIQNKEETKRCDFEFVRSDGRKIHTIIVTSPLFDSKGEFAGVLALINDITERHLAKKSLEEVNKKLNLLSNITRHDILNQITAAAGYLELIELDKEVPPGTEAERYLNKISSIIETIKQQIQFTAYYKNLGEQKPDWFNIGRIVAETFRNNVFGHIELVNNVKNVEVLADPLFEKVIYTLFDNAVTHGEHITQIIFNAEETPNGLLITCEDDGIGIPDGAKEKIFRREHFKNSGLGLFLSKGILAMTGLKIRETGIFGAGARFEISVPEDRYRFSNNS